MMHFNSAGNGMAIGKISEYENLLDVGLDTNFRNVVRFNDVAISDFVVEQGMSGIWAYRKWNSGVAECWGRTEGRKVAINTLWGTEGRGIYTSEDAILSVEYPFPFTSDPKVLATPVKYIDNYNYWIFTCFNGTETMTPSYSAARGSVGENAMVSADLYVIGNWK